MEKTGVMKWFNNRKGYGFLFDDDGNEIFVHYSAILSDGYKSLKEGEKVSFEVTEGKKGLQAINVKKI